MLPQGCQAVIDQKSWEIPAIFKLMQNAGNINSQEMFRTFNCGIGMVLIVPEKEADEILIRLNGLNEQAFSIGEVAKCKAGCECVKMV